MARGHPADGPDRPGPGRPGVPGVPEYAGGEPLQIPPGACPLPQQALDQRHHPGGGAGINFSQTPRRALRARRGPLTPGAPPGSSHRGDTAGSHRKSSFSAGGRSFPNPAGGASSPPGG